MDKQEEIREGINDIFAEWGVYRSEATDGMIDYLHSQGVVIKVNGEDNGFDDFPMPVRGDMLSNKSWSGWKKMIVSFFLKAGYVKTESIKERK